MKCLNPLYIKGSKVPCGHCEACLANKTNEYIVRFMATSRHNYSYFVTLTYDNDNLPLLGVNKEDIKLFLKNLKKVVGSFKYVIVAEYGGRYCRPHYHANLFFKDEVKNIFTVLESVWKYGNVVPVKVDDKQLNYVAKYHSTKVLSSNVYRLRNLPTFARVDIDEKQDMKAVYFTFARTMHWHVEDVIKHGVVKCNDTFRLTSRGIGEELLQEEAFNQSIAKKQYYTINNKGRKSALPRYIVSKLSFSEQVDKVISMLRFAKGRKQNDIDTLAIKMQDYEGALKVKQEIWRKNYEENVLIRKKHAQESYN